LTTGKESGKPLLTQLLHFREVYFPLSGIVFYPSIENKTLSYEIDIVFDCGNTDNRVVIRRIRLERWWINSYPAGIGGHFFDNRIYQKSC
jgi:hypothetical protein